MHSSRMRTARSSSRPGGVSTRHLPQDQTPPRTRHPAPRTRSLPGPDTPPGTRHPPTRHPPGPGTPWDQTPPVDRHTPVSILPCPKLRLQAVTRLHASRMHTTYLLTVSPSMHCAGGVCFWGGLGVVSAPGGLSALGGVCSEGVCFWRGECGGIPACTEADPPCEQNS